MMDRIKAALPDATFTECRELDRPGYIVSEGGKTLKIIELHEGEAGDLSVWNGFLQKRPK